VLISCGTYQSASYNDGIYGDQTTTSAKKKVIIIEPNFSVHKISLLLEQEKVIQVKPPMVSA
jgi:histidinol-phosphate/aromatic aminotransferase/cobyric acid decarboxylase-like protein